MANRIRGITVEIGGDTTKLDKAIKNTNKELSDTQSQLKAVERMLKLDPTNVELLQQKERLLAQASEQAAQKVDVLQKGIEATNEAMQNGSVSMEEGQQQLDALQRGLVAATTQYKSYKDASDRCTESMELFSAKAKKVAEGADKVYNSTKVLSAAATAILGVSANAAMDLEATEAKFNTVFAGSVDVAQEMVDEFQKLTPATEAQTRMMAAGIQDMLVPMGFARDEATNLTSRFMKVAGALTDFNSATEDAESVTSKITAALTGEYSGLKSLGVQLTADQVKQKAVEQGLAATTKEVDLQDQALILLMEMYNQSGDALAAYNEESLDAKTKMDMLKASLTDSAAEMGKSLLPFITQLLESLKGIIDAFNNLSPQTQQIIVKMLALAAVIAPVAKLVSSVAGGLSGAAGTATKLATKIGGLSATMDPVYLQFVKWAAIIIAVTVAITALIAAIAALTGKGGAMQQTMQSISGVTGNTRTTPVQGYASGGVFMPNSPVLGILGDNRSEREVAAPESMLMETFNKALDSRGGGGGVNIEFTGSLAQLGRVLQPVVSYEGTRQGSSFTGR